MVTRAKIQDPNAQQQGNAPVTRLAVGGIQSPQGAPPSSGGNMASAMDAFGAASDALMQKQQDEDYVAGQLAFMAGKTEDEVRAEGNGTTMAGYVTLGVQNSVAEWQQGINSSISSQHFSTNPKELQTNQA